MNEIPELSISPEKVCFIISLVIHDMNVDEHDLVARTWLGRGSDEAMVISTIEMISMRLEQDHCGEVRIAGVTVTLYLTH